MLHSTPQGAAPRGSHQIGSLSGAVPLVAATMADFDLEAFKKMTPKEKMALAKKYTPEQIAKFQEQLADEDLDDMDYGVPTGMVEEEEEEFVYNERAWIDEHGVYRTPEAWKDPWVIPRTPRTGASGRYSAARTTRPTPSSPRATTPRISSSGRTGRTRRRRSRRSCCRGSAPSRRSTGSAIR